MEKFNSIARLEPGALVAGAKESLLNLIDHLRTLAASAGLRESSRSGVVGFVLILIGGHLYYRQKHSFWSRRGIKTPRPLPGVGNLLSFALHPRASLLVEWRRKYGRLFGYYSGSASPVLVCADAAVLKRICIKDFDKFPNRLFVGHPNAFQKHILIALEDDRWRAVRAISSPTFSSGRIKNIFQLLKGCSGNLIDQHQRAIEEQGGQVAIVDTKQIFKQFSLRASLVSFYGVQPSEGADNVNSIENLAKLVRTAVTMQPLRFLFWSMIPSGIVKWIHYPLFSDQQMAPLARRAEKIVQHRRKNPNNKANDYLQLLLDASNQDQALLAQSDNSESHHALEMTLSAPKKPQPNKYKLSEDEIVANSMSNIFVASETSGTLLMSAIYQLAHHPEVQGTLHRELAKVYNLEADDEFQYETLTSCVYLDMVVSESLRLMSPAISLDRIASEDYYVEDYDFTLPKGTPVVLAFSAIMRDPEYWPKPEVFDPERFAPENKPDIVPGSYCPFGAGPRACIGFRFALTEVKLALASLMMRFEFEPAPGTKYPPEPCSNTFVINEMKNLLVKVKHRID